MKKTIRVDAELLALGELALRNAFYREYSQLVEKYKRAALGLDANVVMDGLSAMSNPFSAQDVSSSETLEIAVVIGDQRKVVESVRDAFGVVGDQITIGTEVAFVWKPSTGWYFNDKQRS